MLTKEKEEQNKSKEKNMFGRFERNSKGITEY
jgi:hypothetical protein